MEIADRVHIFPTGRFNPFCWYVVEEEGKLTVVDGGFPKHHRTLVEGLASIGKRISDVEGILLTHAHADHLGFLDRLSRETGRPVHVHADDAAAAQDIDQYPPPGFRKRLHRPFVARFLAYAMRHGAAPFGGVPNLSNVMVIRDGERIDVPGRPKAILTPGHTPGETCFDMPDRGVLMSGDTIVTMNLYSGRATEPHVPREQLNASYVQAVRSLAAIEGLGRRAMVPGHGPVWTGDMRDAVTLARRAAARELGRRGRGLDLLEGRAA